jgi:hypothetical protein
MFYTYDQNNSGGFFVLDSDVTHYVIIEADSHEEANQRAEGVGLYFDGCSKGLDCGCCGDRWSEAWSDEGDPEPMIYGEPVSPAATWRGNPGDTIAYIYRKDGTKQEVTK